MTRVAWLRSAVLVLLLALYAAPVMAQSPTQQQRAILATFCKKQDVKGLNCANARGYPDNGMSTNGRCNVELTGDFYTVDVFSKQVVVAPYTSECEPHASNYGGSVLLVKSGQTFAFKSYAEGSALGNGCFVLKASPYAENIYCIGGWSGQGIVQSGLDEYSVQEDTAAHLTITRNRRIVEATDTTDDSGFQTVTCKHRIEYFSLTNLSLGPASDTLALDVSFADAPMIRSACASPIPLPKDVSHPPNEGDAYLAPANAKQARYVYDTQSGEFTTLERFNDSNGAGAPKPPTAIAAIKPPVKLGRRVALVIGNADYRNAMLANPTFDADLVSASLKNIGFDVTEVKNADFAAFDAAISGFVAKEKQADIALFYFAGHGFAIPGDDLRPRNFLMSTSADIGATSDAILRRDGISIDEIITRISAQAKVTLAFVDACRNDPFHRGGGDRGFNRIGVATGRQIYVGMSTELGKTAIDGDEGKGSPFATAFAEQMTTPGLRIDDAFRALRDEVSQKTDGKQQPEILQDNLGRGAIVLLAAQ